MELTNQKIIDMKKFCILMVSIIVVASSCQKSQFSTVTRHTKNGKVTYANHYPTERTKSSKVTVRKSLLKETEKQNNSKTPFRTGTQGFPELEITKNNSIPIQDYENVIASISNDPLIIAANENRVISIYGLDDDSQQDTIKRYAPNKGAIMDSSINQVIKLKSGHQEKVNILFQSNDVLFYRSITDPGNIHGISIDKVDTIIQKPIKKKAEYKQRTEKLGLTGFIFSILGLVPLYGIPFAILSIIFGAISLRKINHFPERYKGKGFAIASLIIGSLVLIVSAISIIVTITSGGFYMSF